MVVAGRGDLAAAGNDGHGSDHRGLGRQRAGLLVDVDHLRRLDHRRVGGRPTQGADDAGQTDRDDPPAIHNKPKRGGKNGWVPRPVGRGAWGVLRQSNRAVTARQQCLYLVSTGITAPTKKKCAARWAEWTVYADSAGWREVFDAPERQPSRYAPRAVGVTIGAFAALCPRIFRPSPRRKGCAVVRGGVRSARTHGSGGRCKSAAGGRSFWWAIRAFPSNARSIPAGGQWQTAP